jgi:hypothetical protein
VHCSPSPFRERGARSGGEDGAAVARDDDSACGAVCPTGTVGCAFNNSQLAMIVDPGTHYISVDSFNNIAGASVPFTLHIQRLSGIIGGVGGIIGDVVASGVTGVPAGNYSLSGNTGGILPQPTRIHACGTGTPATAAREQSFYWATCPAFAAATFTARTCTAASFDTVLELRSTRQSGTDQSVACEDDSPASCTTSNRSAISTMIPAGAALYQLQLTGYRGANGSATITGTRP